MSVANKRRSGVEVVDHPQVLGVLSQYLRLRDITGLRLVSQRSRENLDHFIRDCAVNYVLLRLLEYNHHSGEHAELLRAASLGYAEPELGSPEYANSANFKKAVIGKHDYFTRYRLRTLPKDLKLDAESGTLLHKDVRLVYTTSCPAQLNGATTFDCNLCLNTFGFDVGLHYSPIKAKTGWFSSSGKSSKVDYYLCKKCATKCVMYQQMVAMRRALEFGAKRGAKGKVDWYQPGDLPTRPDCLVCEAVKLKPGDGGKDQKQIICDNCCGLLEQGINTQEVVGEVVMSEEKATEVKSPKFVFSRELALDPAGSGALTVDGGKTLKFIQGACPYNKNRPSLSIVCNECERVCVHKEGSQFYHLPWNAATDSKDDQYDLCLGCASSFRAQNRKMPGKIVDGPSAVPLGHRPSDILALAIGQRCLHFVDSKIKKDETGKGNALAEGIRDEIFERLGSLIPARLTEPRKKHAVMFLLGHPREDAEGTATLANLHVVLHRVCCSSLVTVPPNQESPRVIDFVLPRHSGSSFRQTLLSSRSSSVSADLDFRWHQIPDGLDDDTFTDAANSTVIREVQLTIDRGVTHSTQYSSSSLQYSLDLRGLTQLSHVDLDGTSGVASLQLPPSFRELGSMPTVPSNQVKAKCCRGLHTVKMGHLFEGLHSGCDLDPIFHALSNITALPDSTFSRFRVHKSLDLSPLKHLVSVGDKCFSNLGVPGGRADLSGLTCLRTIGREVFASCPMLVEIILPNNRRNCPEEEDETKFSEEGGAKLLGVEIGPLFAVDCHDLEKISCPGREGGSMVEVLMSEYRSL